MIFDTHSHYNLDPLLDDWQNEWQQAQDKGVKKTLISGADLDNSQIAIDLAKQDINLYSAAGLHPDLIDENNLPDVDILISQINQLISDNHNDLSAVGEIGLDYYWLKSKDVQHLDQIKQLQEKLFLAQLDMAIEYQLPIIIHCRDKKLPQEKTKGNAYWDLLQLMKQAKQKSDFQFVLHCASGPTEYISQMIDLGAYIGFDGNITYPNADDIRKIFKITPDDKKVIETDAPYLPPQSYRGQTCHPWMIVETARYLEENFDQDLDQLYENATRLLKIEK